MSPRRALAAALVATGLLGASVLAANAIVVRAVPSEGRVLTSFAVPASWPIEVRELLQVGQLVTFTYQVELRRPSTLWLDRTLTRTQISVSAKLDTLTGTYQVTRIRDDRIQRSERREQEADVREWMTSVDQVDLEPSSALEPNREYYVQVRLYMAPRRTVSLGAVWPFGNDDGSGRAVFTYLR